MNKDIVVLVTGASSGIGYETAKLFAEKGYKVYGTSRKANGETENGVTMLRLDVTDDASAKECIEELMSREGKIDILVNNAGFGIAGSIEDTSVEEMRKQLETNLFGVHRMTNLVLPHMRERMSGRIINISSVAGIIAIPYQAFYTVSKFGIEGYTRALRCEARQFGIKVSLVQPGDTKTGFTANRQIAQSTQSSAYNGKMKESVSRMAHDEQNGTAPYKTARRILKTAEQKNPPVSATVGIQYKAIKLALRLLPERLVSRAIAKLYA